MCDVLNAGVAAAGIGEGVTAPAATGQVTVIRHFWDPLTEYNIQFLDYVTLSVQIWLIVYPIWIIDCVSQHFKYDLLTPQALCKDPSVRV